MYIDKRNPNKSKFEIYSKYKDILIEMNKDIELILNDLNKLINDELPNFIKKSQKLQSELNKCIDNYLTSIKGFFEYNVDINQEDHQNLIENIKSKLSSFNVIISNIYENNYINKMKELNEKLYDIADNLEYEVFDPPQPNSLESEPNFSINNQNSLSQYNNIFNQINSGNQSYLNYCDNINEKEEDIEIKDIELICSVCSKKEAKSLCEKCNQLFCDDCYDMVRGSEEKNKHINQKITTIKDQKKLEKKMFLNSMNKIIKCILTKSNYLITNEDIISKYAHSNNNNSNNSQFFLTIKRKFNYPYIKDINDYNSQIEFLNGINKLLENNFNIRNLDLNSFHISEMDNSILKRMKEIFIDEKVNLIQASLDEILEFEFENENDYSDECLNLESNDTNIDENEFIKNKNKFYYVINLVSQGNFKFNKKNIKILLIKKLKDLLNIDEYNIFITFNNKNHFINSFIKTKDFSTSSFSRIIKNYPGLDKLYEYKKIYENILNIKDFKDYLDYLGNTICPNSSYNLMRGKEKYYPPYGWFGIGLNVLGKYDNGNDEWLDKNTNKWAIAYYCVGQNTSSIKIREILNKIIIEKKLDIGTNQYKASSIDKRHPNKKVGFGVYLTPNIKIAEKFAGKIFICGKKYKIVLMAKVLIDEIREPNDINYWILNKDFVRFYRILVKESV